jgi:hypothetical protein
MVLYSHITPEYGIRLLDSLFDMLDPLKASGSELYS